MSWPRSADVRVAGSAEVSDDSTRIRLTPQGRCKDLRVADATDVRLYQSGSAWLSKKVPVGATFRATTKFKMTCFKGEDRKSQAEGMAFVLQNSDDLAVGADGFGLGYDGIANSLAVEFDTYQQWAFDLDDNHISISTNGSHPNSAWDVYYSINRTNFNGVPSLLRSGVNLHDGADHVAVIDYSAGLLSVSIDDVTVLQTHYDVARSLSLSSGTASVGFTASTGEGAASHEVLEMEVRVFVVRLCPCFYFALCVDSHCEAQTEFLVCSMWFRKVWRE